MNKCSKCSYEVCECHKCTGGYHKKGAALGCIGCDEYNERGESIGQCTIEGCVFCKTPSFLEQMTKLKIEKKLQERLDEENETAGFCNFINTVLNDHFVHEMKKQITMNVCNGYIGFTISESVDLHKCDYKDTLCRVELKRKWVCNGIVAENIEKILKKAFGREAYVKCYSTYFLVTFNW